MTRKGKSAAAPSRFLFVCPRCGANHSAAVQLWRCTCGAPLLPSMPPFDPAAIDTGDRSVWRYRAMLPLDPETPRVSLGEGGTPCVHASLAGWSIRLKLDYLQPSGSYKDRGSAVLAAALAGAGVASAVEDSSGNAGASLAAYLAGFNLPLQLFVPRDTAPGKLRQAEAHGALIDSVARSRREAGERAQAAVTGSAVYASHVYSPYFLAGLMTMAWELWEALDRRAPDNCLVPVGQGLLLLGLYEGFRVLEAAGLIERLPRLYGVQARACAPIFDAFTRNAEAAFPVAGGETIADGIRVEAPPRSTEVLAAVRSTGGAMINVNEDEIARGWSLAANLGWYIEPTAAAAVSGLFKLDKLIDPAETTVVPLTGSGLKIG